MNLEEGLIRKMEKIYENTEVMMRSEEEYTESFVTKRGVRQRCY